MKHNDLNQFSKIAINLELGIRYRPSSSLNDNLLTFVLYETNCRDKLNDTRRNNVHCHTRTSMKDNKIRLQDIIYCK